MTYPRNTFVIDLSHWNDVTDWSAIKAAGVVGVIHKFSQGASYRDPTYEARREAATAAGLLWGRYHFGDASDVQTQVGNALTGLQPGDLLALDWEDNANSQMTLGMARDFASEVEARTGALPILYSGNALKDAMAVPGADPGVLTRCRLWLAHYAAAPVCPPGWSTPWLWQWSDTGRVAGVNGDVDADAFDGTRAELAADWTGTAPAPEPEVAVVTVTISAPPGVKVVVKT